MKTSSRLAWTGLSSCSATPAASAASPMLGGVETRDQERAVVPAVTWRPRPTGASRRTGRHRGCRTSTVATVFEADEVGDRRVGDQLTPADDDQIGGGQRHLTHQVARHEDGASLGGQRLQQVAHPQDALGVEPVDRLVEEQDARVAEKRRGDAQALAHPEGELPGPATGHAFQAHLSEHLVHPGPRDRVGLGQCQQVVVGGATGVDGLGLEQGADLPQRPPQIGKTPAADGHRPRVGVVETHHHAHGRRLARPVRSEESRDDPGADREGEVVDRPGRTVGLGQPIGRDHRRPRAGDMLRRYQEVRPHRRRGRHRLRCTGTPDPAGQAPSTRSASSASPPGSITIR